MPALITSEIVKLPGPFRFQPGLLFTIEIAGPARPPTPRRGNGGVIDARRQAYLSTQLRNTESARIAASELAAARCTRNHFPVRVH
jgi:hypothetical protein